MVVMAAIGCGGPREGQVHPLPKGAWLYLEEAGFRDAQQLEAAGTHQRIEDQSKLLSEGKFATIEDGARVRIVERTTGGAKVAVISGKHEGRLGWILNSDLNATAR
jgi:hypothetical protein